MDVEAIVERAPKVCVVDELAHTNVPGSRHAKRYEDVLDLLEAGIHVMTAVNIQHLETLNDAVAKATGVRVRETVPDTFLDRADEVINVDVTVEELRNRLRAGKIYAPEKVEQALTNFFRKGNLSTLRELALRAVADEVGEKAASYRAREGLEPALIPERVMVCMSSNALRSAGDPDRRADCRPARGQMVRCLRPDAARAARAASGRGTRRRCRKTSGSRRASARRLSGSRRTARPTGLSRSRSVKGSRTSSSARAPGRGWSCVWRESTLNKFLSAVPDAAVQVRPVERRRRLARDASVPPVARVVRLRRRADRARWLSAWHLWRMSALSERIIAENYNSVVAAQDMKESLERQDSAGLFVLLDRWDRALPQLREHRARFDAAYQRAAGQHHRARRSRGRQRDRP